MIGELKNNPSRRGVIRALSLGAGAVSLTGCATKPDSGPYFSHGIASGDPQQDRVILWTRVLDSAGTDRNITGVWQISDTEEFATIKGGGSFKTGPERDYTVKVDASGLMPGVRYFYRFRVGNVFSPVGKTRTLPEGKTDIKLAVVSCSNYSHGHFHVYAEMAKRDYQAILHLGDYIYEYAEGVYDNAAVLEQGRTSKPKTEAVSLDDYRRRYAGYRTDPDLLAAHAAHPFICVWDDHEVANDTWKEGAQNHSEDQGDFKIRQKAAMRAYFEWLPLRESAQTEAGKIYRTFELGDLASLIMLDTRHIGRDKGLSYQSDLPMTAIPFDMRDPENPKAILSAEAAKDIAAKDIKPITVPFLLQEGSATPMTDWATIKALDPANLPEGYSYLPDSKKFRDEILGNKERSLLGSEQENWLSAELAKSKTRQKPWQILGQQLLCGKLGIPNIADSEFDYDKSPFLNQKIMAFFRMLGQMGFPLNLDAWDGYPACRDRVFASIKANANNAVFLAGDTHNAWAFDLADNKGEAVGVELGTPGVSSPGMEHYLPAAPGRVEEELRKASPELKFTNTKDRGWMELDITEQAVSAQWNFVSSVITPEYRVMAGPEKSTKAGTRKLS